jgi:phosphoglycolate phosphatase-like HAD superfamily hydrolase
LNILLFDVDGVLVEDRGYRAGVIAVANHYARLMGLAPLPLEPAALDLFHAHGYTNEWDSCPFTIGILILEALQQAPAIAVRPAAFEEMLRRFKAAALKLSTLPVSDYLAAADQLPGRPSERARAALRDRLQHLPLSGETRAAAESILDVLFADPYNFERSPVTQLFQEQMLGSSTFEETYQRRPRFDLPSLLYDEDRSLLKEAARQTLIRLAASPQTRLCIYTARPSLPPADAANWLIDPQARPIGYSPEAELAVQLTHLSDYPLIAMGRMQWLAAQVNERVEQLTKPSPVQALAAIGAALTRHEADSLKAAYALVSRGEWIEPLNQLKDRSFEVWVVEDATLGLQAAQGAIELLCRQSIDIQLHVIGIANGGPKAAALEPLSEIVLPDVNRAIDYLDQEIQKRAQSQN